MNPPPVNPALTANRPTRPGRGHRLRRVENDDYAAFSARVLAAHGRRIAAGDIEGLTALTDLACLVEQAIAHAVTGLRAAGYSWTDIAGRLGVTRQAAHQRFATRKGRQR